MVFRDLELFQDQSGNPVEMQSSVAVSPSALGSVTIDVTASHYPQDASAAVLQSDCSPFLPPPDHGQSCGSVLRFMSESFGNQPQHPGMSNKPLKLTTSTDGSGTEQVANPPQVFALHTQIPPCTPPALSSAQPNPQQQGHAQSQSQLQLTAHAQAQAHAHNQAHFQGLGSTHVHPGVISLTEVNAVAAQAQRQALAQAQAGALVEARVRAQAQALVQAQDRADAHEKLQTFAHPQGQLHACLKAECWRYSGTVSPCDTTLQDALDFQSDVRRSADVKGIQPESISEGTSDSKSQGRSHRSSNQHQVWLTNPCRTYTPGAPRQYGLGQFGNDPNLVCPDATTAKVDCRLKLPSDHHQRSPNREIQYDNFDTLVHESMLSSVTSSFQTAAHADVAGLYSVTIATELDHVNGVPFGVSEHLLPTSLEREREHGHNPFQHSGDHFDFGTSSKRLDGGANFENCSTSAGNSKNLTASSSRFTNAFVYSDTPNSLHAEAKTARSVSTFTAQPIAPRPPAFQRRNAEVRYLFVQPEPRYGESSEHGNGCSSHDAHGQDTGRSEEINSGQRISDDATTPAENKSDAVANANTGFNFIETNEASEILGCQQPGPTKGCSFEGDQNNAKQLSRAKRNRESADRSRKKKKERSAFLEKEVRNLKQELLNAHQENHQLRLKIAEGYSEAIKHRCESVQFKLRYSELAGP